jgi:hypothetical protein
MINRLTTGWNFIRLIYVLAGIALMFQGYIEEQWFAAAFGGYLASMGLFNYGCATNGCVLPKNSPKSTNSK